MLLLCCLQSQSVESKHAVFEWNQKEESYVIRDLDSVNGVGSRATIYNSSTLASSQIPMQTYVNMLPLRDKITVLKHGDTIRFGYGEAASRHTAVAVSSAL